MCEEAPLGSFALVEAVPVVPGCTVPGWLPLA